jgi:hypothetical protein
VALLLPGEDTSLVTVARGRGAVVGRPTSNRKAAAIRTNEEKDERN